MTQTPTGRHARAPSSMHAKRVLDLVLALLALVVCAPLLLAIYLAVRIDTRGPGIFRQQRVGMHQRCFVMYKFRTMHRGAPDGAHREYIRRLLDGEARPSRGLYKLDQDLRVTRVGAFLRRTSLDELPQLLNVVRGDMSLVGPRPPLEYEVELFPDWAMSRFQVPPGLTGLWQVNGRNRLTMTEGLRLDIDYAATRGLRQDLRILFRTVPALLRDGAR